MLLTSWTNGHCRLLLGMSNNKGGMRASILQAAAFGSQRGDWENNEIMGEKYFVSCKSVYTSEVTEQRVLYVVHLFSRGLEKMNVCSVVV